MGLGVCKDAGVDEHVAQTASLGVDVYLAGLVHRTAGTSTIWSADGHVLARAGREPGAVVRAEVAPSR